MKLSVQYLKPGMVVSYPVFGSKGELLLKRGSKLTSNSIKALRNRRILAIYIKAGRVTDDEMYEAKNVLDDSIRLDALNLVQEWIVHNKTKKFIFIEEKVKDIISELLKGKVPVYGLSEICTVDQYTYAHSVDVCVLAVMIGCQLGYEKSQLLELGVGSLLHDYGKTQLDNELLNKPDKLTSDEMSRVKRHAEMGYEILSAMGEISPSACEIILNHHERYDGSGYPNGLSGDQLPMYSEVCAIADVYNAVTTDRVYRKAIHPGEAYEMLPGSGDRLFSMLALRAFLQHVTPWPLGTLCRLSTGDAAQVVALEPSMPLRPEVMLLRTGEVMKPVMNFP